jgi:CubicO group peptidase (beta-lactamase class C family)
MKPASWTLAAALTAAALAATTTAQQRSLDDVRARILTALASGRAPSLAVAVARDGRIIWSDGFGFADKARRTPATAATPYGVASITKTFTATALMVLSERGRIGLDDPIARHLGATVRPNVTDASGVTIRRTLQNVGGVSAALPVVLSRSAAAPALDRGDAAVLRHRDQPPGRPVRVLKSWIRRPRRSHRTRVGSILRDVSLA